VVTRIGYVALSVQDLDAATRFYTEIVGVRVVERVGERVYLSSNDRHHEVILSPASAGQAGFRQLGLEVAPGTLDAAVDRAVRAGASEGHAPNTHGVDSVRAIQAPAGFHIEFFEGMETTDVQPQGSGPVRFEHINLATPAIDSWNTFLADGLGLRWSDRAHDPNGTIISWFHCPVPGADHHGVATTRAPEARLHHIKWEYADVVEVVERVDEFCGAGESLVWGIGRHGVDRSIFAYVKDPEGLMNELGLGMIKVDSSPHWEKPRDLPVDTPHLADLWGSMIPQPWLEAGIPLVAPELNPSR
jgi:catechol 2,3-dioxygenase